MSKFENTVIVTDLDGTFLDDKEGLVERNLEAVEYFKKNGGYFTIATGRAAEHVRGAIPEVEKLINLPAVTCNGACLHDFGTEEVVACYGFDYDLAMELISFVRQKYPQVGVRASAQDYCFVTTDEDVTKPLVASDLKRYKTTKHFIRPLKDWKQLQIHKIVLRVDAERIDALKEDVKEKFGDRVSVTQSWSTIIDVQMGGINKGVTLERYVRETMGKECKIYACGDYLNDAEMLAASDVAVCPSNAHPKIKEMSELCLCSNNQGLIADLIEYIERKKENEN